MPPKVFKFQEQLKMGNEGEAAFLKFYAKRKPVKSVQNRDYDFLIDGDKKVELKTDQHCLTETENFFIETVSDEENNSPGGPYRAARDSVDYFVYYFSKNKIFFWFEPISLCRLVDKIIAKGKEKPKKINNKSWITVGYAIKRDSLKEICLKIDDFNHAN